MTLRVVLFFMPGVASKVEDYGDHVAPCERVLESYPQWHYDEENDSHFVLTSHFDEDQSIFSWLYASIVVS